MFPDDNIEIPVECKNKEDEMKTIVNSASQNYLSVTGAYLIDIFM